MHLFNWNARRDIWNIYYTCYVSDGNTTDTSSYVKKKFYLVTKLWFYIWSSKKKNNMSIETKFAQYLTQRIIQASKLLSFIKLLSWPQKWDIFNFFEIKPYLYTETIECSKIFINFNRKGWKMMFKMCIRFQHVITNI